MKIFSLSRDSSGKFDCISWEKQWIPHIRVREHLNTYRAFPLDHSVGIRKQRAVSRNDQSQDWVNAQSGGTSAIFYRERYINMGASGVKRQRLYDLGYVGYPDPGAMRDSKLVFGLFNLLLHLSELSAHDYELVDRGTGEYAREQNDQPISYGAASSNISPKTHVPDWLLIVCGLGCSVSGLLCLICCHFFLFHDKNSRGALLCFLLGAALFALVFVFGHRYANNIVPRKYSLTIDNYWGTVIPVRRLAMANILPTDKKIAVIGALAEGSSIRSIERITGVHRDTIMRLGVKVGQGCTALMDAKMRDLSCNRLEMDEIWGFIGKKDRNVRPGEMQVGNVWTFCVIDADTKLVPAFKVGNRDTARRTRTIVVMNTIFRWFFNLINGIEDSRCGHGISPSVHKLYSELWPTIFKN
jgi:hypothetical protein